jgi:NADPH:quinone reductase-like Zn-dependent oxidoreductase
VLIQVAYAAVNYKDALACINDVTVARTYPHVFALS